MKKYREKEEHLLAAGKWSSILKIWAVPCNNCSKCAPDKIPLVELTEAEPQENTAIALALEFELQKLAVQLGNEV
jgi:hypothetical protein